LKHQKFLLGNVFFTIKTWVKKVIFSLLPLNFLALEDIDSVLKTTALFLCF